MIEQSTLWIVIIGLGLGSFMLRFIFIGFVGNRPIAPWLLRYLRYTAVSVLPALVAPLVIWPSATDGDPDPARMAAAAVTLVVGLITKHVLSAMCAGAVTLYAMLYLLG